MRIPAILSVANVWQPIIQLLRHCQRNLRLSSHTLGLFHLLFELFDSSFDPWVLEGVFRRHPLLWLPFKTVIDEVNKVVLRGVALH